MKTENSSYKLSGLSESQREALKIGKLLPLMEDFFTIQGEGRNTGLAAHFLRLGGCDVGCHWCDVKESWDAALHPLTTLEEIIDKIKSSKAGSAVITGGEPLLYNLEPLTSSLQELGTKTYLETSGAYPLSGQWDWICLSPKKTMPVQEKTYAFANELKIIVHNIDDFSWAVKQAEKVRENTLLYLQPEWSKREKMTPLIVDFVKSSPAWRISLQTHKYMNIP